MRSITTLHTRHVDLVLQESFWRELLLTWSFLPVTLADGGEYTPRMQTVIARLNPEARARALSGMVLLLEDVDRPTPNECLISVDAQTSEVSIRIFGRFLTDIQSTSEWILRQLMTAGQVFIITPHTRCFIALDTGGQRTDLTTGRAMPLRHRLWHGFYQENVYNINVTSMVITLTLMVVLFTSPTEAHSALGKFYGLCERILSAALMNVFLLLSQFYVYRKGRRVLEWEKP